MECGYGCLSKSGHPLPQRSSGRIKLTVPPGGVRGHCTGSANLSTKMVEISEIWLPSSFITPSIL